MIGLLSRALPSTLVSRFNVLMVAFSVLTVSVVFILSNWQHRQHAIEETRAAAVENAHTILDAAETTANADSLKRFLQFVAAKPMVRDALLTDAEGNVVLSSRRSWINTPLDALDDTLVRPALAPASGQSNDSQWDAEAGLAVAILPIALTNPPADAVVQSLEGGQIILSVDGQSFLAEARAEALADAAGTGALVLLILAVLALVLRYSLGRPIQELYRYASHPQFDKHADMPPRSPIHELAVLTDRVSALAETRQELARERDRLADIANTIPGAMYEFYYLPSGEQLFTYVSEGIKPLFHLENDLDTQAADRRELAEKIWSRVVAEDARKLDEATHRVMTEGEPFWTAEFRVTSEEGVRWIRGQAVKVDEQQAPGHLFRGVLLDINERVQLEQRLRNAAIHDPLTGALNRSGIDVHFDSVLASSERTGSPAAVLMLDIDHFKQVNDIHGHEVGDDVLVELVRRATTRLRESDTLVRWGGEEFLVLMPDTELDGAGRLAESLRRIIADRDFGSAGKVTISLGAAQSRVSDTPKTLTRRADRALYRAKAAGRNRVFLESDVIRSKKSSTEPRESMPDSDN